MKTPAAILLLLVACDSPPEPLGPTYTISDAVFDGPMAWVVEGEESLLVVASLSRAPVVRVAGQTASDSGALSPTSRSWAFPDDERVTAIAVVDVDADGDDELLVHLVTEPPGSDRLRLIDPEEVPERSELLWDLPIANEELVIFNRSLVAVHGAMSGAPSDVMAMVLLGGVIDLPSYRAAPQLGVEAMDKHDNPDLDVLKAHKHSSNHREELSRSEACGCFYCLGTYPYDLIDDWIDDEQTALCPECGIDSVIGSASGFEIEPWFLKRMRQYWFDA